MNDDTLTRAQLSYNIYKEVGIPQSEAAEIVDFIFDQMINSLSQDEIVKITSFGSFYVLAKKARIGRNPKTKKEAEITARKVISFYASNLLKKQINKNNFHTS